MIFPLVIISLFSKREAGFFYIPWMIFSMYCGFIGAVLSIFLMEASHGEDVKKLLNKVLAFIFLLALVGFLFFTFLGDKVLLFFKKEFSLYSFNILKILFSSIFFFSINQIYLTLKNIEKKIVEFGILSSVIVLSMAILAFMLIPLEGLEGIAFSWFFANLVGNVLIITSFIKNRIQRVSAS